MPQPQSRGCQDNERAERDIDECHEFHLRFSLSCLPLPTGQSRDTPCRRPETFGSAAPALMTGHKMLLSIKSLSHFDLDQISRTGQQRLGELSATPPFGTLRRRAAVA